MREFEECPRLRWWKLIPLPSVEHDDVQVVACNDPFIEPKYAVSELLHRENRH